MGDEISRHRQRLRRTAEQHQQQLELVLAERGPLIRGSFGTRTRKCGKPNCRCARGGELHESKYLTATDSGKVRQVHVPAADEVKVHTGAKRYRQFQQARRKLAKLAKLQLELVDALGRSLLEPYPPDKSIPPARKRGRQRKREAGASS